MQLQWACTFRKCISQIHLQGFFVGPELWQKTIAQGSTQWETEHRIMWLVSKFVFITQPPYTLTLQYYWFSFSNFNDYSVVVVVVVIRRNVIDDYGWLHTGQGYYWLQFQGVLLHYGIFTTCIFYFSLFVWYVLCFSEIIFIYPCLTYFIYSITFVILSLSSLSFFPASISFFSLLSSTSLSRAF